MREIVTVSVGQAGNQIGWRFWDVLVREHAACGFAGSSIDALSSFFRPAEGGLRVPGLSNQGLRARAVLVDMEEGVVAQMHRSSIRGLFDSTCSVTDVSGAGNNWAHGYAVCGPHHRAPITDRLRLALEACESPQAFFLTHSLGGGTGSGVGSYILELLADEFPEPYRITASLFPSDNDDVVTSPYNALLATSRLVDSADSVFSIENQALIDIMGAAAKGAQNEGGFAAAAGDSSAAAALKSAPASSSQSSPKRDAAASSQQPAVIAEETLPSAALRSILSVADDLLAASTALPAVKSSAASAAQIYKSGGPPARGNRVATASSKTGIPTRGAKGITSGGIKQNSKTSVAQRLASAHQGVGRAAVRTDSNAQRQSTTIAGADDAREKQNSLKLSPPRVLSSQEEQRASQQPDRETPAPATAPPAAATAAAPRSGTSWDAMNEFVARLLSDVTAGMRFPGSLNLDLNEIASTLVPFPRMHFLSTRYEQLSSRAGLTFSMADALCAAHPLPTHFPPTA